MGEIFNKKKQTPLRRDLRNKSTEAEKKLWSKLKGSQLLGYKFRRQHGVEPFVVDFYCPDVKLVIEVDGATHITDEELTKDRMRQKAIEGLGLTVFRCTNRDVFDNLDGVLLAIAEKLQELNAKQPAPPLGKPAPPLGVYRPATWYTGVRGHGIHFFGIMIQQLENHYALENRICHVFTL
jgi:very-short-patch-repair endonuclease